MVAKTFQAPTIRNLNDVKDEIANIRRFVADHWPDLLNDPNEEAPAEIAARLDNLARALATMESE